MRVTSTQSESCRPAGSSIEGLIEDICKRLIKERECAALRLIESRCPYCRYARVCNPKRGVEGFSTKYDATACEVGFTCSKGKPRKDPIPFEETRIAKIVRRQAERK